MKIYIDAFSTTSLGLAAFLHCFDVPFKPAFYIFANLDHIISALLVLCFLVTYFVARSSDEHSGGYFPSKLDRNHTHKTCFNFNLKIKYKHWKK
mgnify:CR=1 FL=1